MSINKNQKRKQKVVYTTKESNLTDNSKKYDLLYEDSDEEPPDFSYLLQQHTATGSHFVFKEELKKFQGDSFTTQKYFNVDTKLLNLAFESIPFQERHNSGIEWSAEELDRMTERARDGEKAYFQLINIKLHKSEKGSRQKVSIETDRAVVTAKEVRIESLKSEEDKSSMEKWLDDILDV